MKIRKITVSLFVVSVAALTVLFFAGNEDFGNDINEYVVDGFLMLAGASTSGSSGTPSEPSESEAPSESSAPSAPYTPSAPTTAAPESGKGTIAPSSVTASVLKAEEAVKAVAKVVAPAKSLVIGANIHGELNGYKAFSVSAADLKAAGIDVSKAKLWYVDDSGKVTDESKKLVKKPDGSLTINFTHFSAYVLSETAPIQCTSNTAIAALKATLKGSNADDVALYDYNRDGKLAIADAIAILKASL